MMRRRVVLVCASVLSMATGCPTDDAPQEVNAAPTAVVERGGVSVGTSATLELEVGASLTLDASKSTDPDGDELDFAWALSGPDGAEIAEGSSAAFSHTFVEAGTYALGVTVSDGELDATGSVTVVVTAAANLEPIADAGADASVVVGTPATLDASGSSDPDGGTLGFTWSITDSPAGSTATLDSATASSPSLTPDFVGTYSLTLVVTDGDGGMDTDSVDVTATAPLNGDPVADAGDDQDVVEGVMVIFDASGSTDPDGDTLTYSWEITTAPANSTAALDDTTSDLPILTPDLHGTYTLTLTVDDGNGATATDTVDLTVNGAPTADAGPDQSVLTGSLVTLEGSNSSDPEGESLLYLWALETAPAGSAATLAGDDTPTPSFTPDVEGVYVIDMLVGDTRNQTSMVDTVVVTASAP